MTSFRIWTYVSAKSWLDTVNIQFHFGWSVLFQAPQTAHLELEAGRDPCGLYMSIQDQLVWNRGYISGKTNTFVVDCEKLFGKMDLVLTEYHVARFEGWPSSLDWEATLTADGYSRAVNNISYQPLWLFIDHLTLGNFGEWRPMVAVFIGKDRIHKMIQFINANVKMTSSQEETSDSSRCAYRRRGWMIPD